MERLTFGYGVPKRHVETPAVRRVEPPPEAQVHAVVADPLPGESSDWAYFGLLAFTAVLFFRPQDTFPFLASLHLAELSAMVGLAAMVMKRLARRLPVVHLTAEVYGLVAFGLVLVATTPFSFWPGGSVEVITGMYLKVLLIVVLMINSLNTPVRLRQFTWLVVFASSYVSLRTIIDYLRGINIVEGGRAGGAVSGIFGNPNDLALNMVVFLPYAALFALLAVRTRPGGKQRRNDDQPRQGAQLTAAVTLRLFAAGAVLVMLTVIVFTKSRSGFLGLAATLLVLLYYGRRLKPGLAAAAIVLIVAVLPLLPSSFWLRMSSITDASEDVTGSREARLQLAIEAAKVFAERPLTGIGAGQFKNYNPPDKLERWREAHDVWLQVASETGIFGLLVFAYLVYAAFHAALWSRRRLASYAKATSRKPRRRGKSRRWRRAAASDDASPPALPGVEESTDMGILHLQASALVPSLVGWFVCATFASVAYNWTFYYLLGLAVVMRDLTRAALAARAFDAPVPAPTDSRHHRAPMAAPAPAS